MAPLNTKKLPRLTQVTTEERFYAAVNVIKGLPKNGPYQPSSTMMLKFYGLYKHATEGVCHQKKPAFWDIIGRAKWEAYNKNRHLTQEEAMQQYVEGLQEIIETMSFTENVQNFVGSLSGLDNIDLDELDLISPGMREIAESHPNSPFNSRTNSPQRNANINGDVGLNSVPMKNGLNKPNIHEQPSDRLHAGNNNNNNNNDTGDTVTTTTINPNDNVMASVSRQSNGNNFIDQSDDEYADPFDMNHEFTEAMLHNSELLKQIQATVLRMNADLVLVNQRMGLLEKTVQDVRTVMQKTNKQFGDGGRTSRLYPKWWPFDDISPGWFVLLVLWPFVVNRLSRLTHARRK